MSNSGSIEAALRRGAGEPIPGSARLARRAAEEGILDLAYTTAETPVGPLLIAATELGLVRVVFDRDDFDSVLADLSARISPRILEAPARLDRARRELDEYFEGKRRKFDLPLDWRLSRGFGLAARRELVKVPFGETVSYGELAGMAGHPRAARAVGTAMAQNPVPLVVPCHRVIRADGSIGEYGGGPGMKEFLLDLESGG